MLYVFLATLFLCAIPLYCAIKDYNVLYKSKAISQFKYWFILIASLIVYIGALVTICEVDIK